MFNLGHLQRTFRLIHNNFTVYEFMRLLRHYEIEIQKKNYTLLLVSSILKLIIN